MPARPAALNARSIASIRQHAERAALGADRSFDRPAPNPYRPGTRAHVLWVTTHHLGLMRREDEESARAARASAAALGERIAKIRRGEGPLA